MMPKSTKILAITLLILLGVYSFYTIPSVRRAMALAYTNTITNTLTLTRSQPLVTFTAASVEGSRGTSTGLADRIRTGLRRWLGIGDGGTTTVIREQVTDTTPTTTVIERVVERVIQNPTAPTTIVTTAGGADELWYQNLYNAVAGLRAELIPLIDLAMRRPMYEPHSRKSSGGSSNSTPSGNYLPLAGGTLTGPVSGPDATFTDATTDNLTINGTLTDGTSSAGLNGYVLQSTGTGIEWVATSTLGLGGTDFSTTSADFWITTKSLEDLGDVSTMSQNTGDLLYWNGSAWANIATSSLNITQDLSGYFTLADWYATTTDALDEGNTNLYFTDQRVADYIVSSTTIANATPTNGNILLGNGTNWTSVGTSSLGIPGPDGDFSTTSADYWETQQTPRTADDLSDNSLEELQDVASMSQAIGDLLYWNGSAWTNIATSSLNITQDLSGYFTLADWYATTTDALDEGNTNLYFTDQRVADYIASTTIPTATPTDGFVLLGDGVAWTAVSTSTLGFPGPDGDFSTTSADFWITTKSLEDLGDVSTMSQNTGDLLYWNGSAWANIATSSLNITQDLSGYFTLADWYATTTDALDEGNTNLYFTDQRVADYIVSSTTIANATPTNGNILLGNGTNWTSVSTSSLGISGNINAGTTGQVTYYAADGTTVSGTSSLFIASDGKIGIGGIINPAEALDVDGNIKVNAGIGFGDVGAAFTAGGIYVARGLQEAVMPEAMNLGGHGGFTFSVNDTPGATSTPKMVIASDGKVGIGTTTPSAQLTIQGANGVASPDPSAPTALAVYGGAGSSFFGSPGKGSDIILIAGEGGSSSGFGGIGGSVLISAGDGGEGTTEGVGGSVTIQAGDFGNVNSGGHIYLTPGTEELTGDKGTVFVTQGHLAVATSSSFTLSDATFYVAGNAAIGTGFNTTPPTNGLLVQGNVGIGTTTVSQKLHVDGNVVISGTTTASCFTTDGTTCITGAGSGSGTVNSGTSGQFAYYASSGDAVSGSSLLTTDSGNIGIGTSTPSAKLTVAGTSLFTGNATFGAFASFNGDAIYNANVYLNSGLYDGSVSPGLAGYVLQSTGTSTEWVATSSLNIDGGGTVTAGTEGQVAYYDADGNTISGTSSLFIASDGKIGIGTSTPSEKLHVEGNATITGTIGIGTSTPQASLHVIGDTIISGTTTTNILGIGTTTPSAPLTVDGYALITGGLTVGSSALFNDGATFGGDVLLLGSLSDSGASPGTPGYVLQSTGTGVEWVATSSLGLDGGGGGSSKWTDGGAFIYPTDGEYISVPYIVSTSTATSTFAGNIVMSGSIIPSASGTYDLGSPSMPWSDVYISEASLYIDGQKVLQADNDNIVVSADINQSLIVKTTGVGDVELNPSGSGVIYMKGNTQFSGGKVISTSDNSVLEFEDGILAGNLNIDGNTITASNTDGSITLMPNGDGKILLSGGNVGIGTSTPSQKLHVQGNARITGALYDSTNAAGSNGYVLLSTGTGTQWVATSTLGLGGSGGSGTVNSGTTGQFGYYAADGTTISGTSLLTTDSGNIGIGTSTPSAKLHVAGDARFEGALYDNVNSTGLAGYVLASTGTGVEWVATSTLGMEGGTGGGGIGPNGILPASMLYKPASPSALNCEFDDGVTGCLGWSFVGPHSDGTVDHTVQQTTFIRDTDTWPGWTLWQGDNQSAVSYAVAERTYTQASEEQWIFRPMSTGAVSATNEGRSALCYRNSGDSNENVCVGLHTAGASERIEMYCTNNGSLSVVGSISSAALSDSIVLGIQKNGDVYSGYVYPSDGGFSHPTNAMAFGSCTKTGNTTFDTIQYQVSTANETPSPVTGVDFIRYYASRTFALLNPAPANAGAGIISAGLQGQVAYYADSGTTTLSGSSNLVIDTSGNVGVGTSTPSEKLHVEGNAIITGTTTASCFSTDGINCLADSGEFATTTADFWLSTKSLQDLGDVATMTATTGDLLYWNGSEWANIATSSLGLGGGGGGGGSGTVNTATTGQFAYYASDGTAVSGQSVLTTDGTNIGIGTTTPGEKLDVWGNFRVGVSETPLIFANTGTGMLGIGTASPSAKLHVVGSTRFEGGNFSVGGGGIFHNTLTNMTSIESLNLGNMSFDTDAGMVSWINLPISTSPAAGVVQSYSAQIDDNPLLTLYGESDGSGGARNMRVGIGTTTPNALLTLQGSAATSSTLLFNVASSSGASIFSIWSNATASTTAGGRVGVGMASSDAPLTTLEVRGFNEAPTTGSSTNGILGLYAEGITPELSMGVTTVGGVYTWIQGKHRTDPNTYYPVVINPNGGNVGIGTTTEASASSTLTVAGGVSLLDLPTVSSFPQDVLCITTEGVVQRNLGAGTCTTSSIRFKHGDKNLEIGLTQLVQLRPVSFVYNGTEEERVGFIAEDVDKIEGLDPFVFREEDGTPRGVRYEDMVALAVKAIQELNAKVETLLTAMAEGVVEFAKIIADNVTTRELCLDDVCITKYELQQLLDSADVQSAPQQPEEPVLPEEPPVTPPTEPVDPDEPIEPELVPMQEGVPTEPVPPEPEDPVDPDEPTDPDPEVPTEPEEPGPIEPVDPESEVPTQPVEGEPVTP